MFSAPHSGFHLFVVCLGFPPFSAGCHFGARLITKERCNLCNIVLYCIMTQTQNQVVTDEQWNKAADIFELGLKHASEIASDLGVSPSTVSRELKRRGCIKGSRSGETVIELEAFLKRRDQREALRRLPEREVAERLRAATDALIDDMMRTIMAADRAGDLTLANPKIDKILKALNVKPIRD